MKILRIVLMFGLERGTQMILLIALIFIFGISILIISMLLADHYDNITHRRRRREKENRHHHR